MVDLGAILLAVISLPVKPFLCKAMMTEHASFQITMFFVGFSSFAWQRGTLQLIAINPITLHNILEYMQIAIIQTEAADFVKIYICVSLKTFGHDCSFKEVDKIHPILQQFFDNTLCLLSV